MTMNECTHITPVIVCGENIDKLDKYMYLGEDGDLPGDDVQPTARWIKS